MILTTMHMTRFLSDINAANIFHRQKPPRDAPLEARPCSSGRHVPLLPCDIALEAAVAVTVAPQPSLSHLPLLSSPQEFGSCVTPSAATPIFTLCTRHFLFARVTITPWHRQAKAAAAEAATALPPQRVCSKFARAYLVMCAVLCRAVLVLLLLLLLLLPLR